MQPTILGNVRKALRVDNAVSPVIGTILMVAVTVALAATVLTIMNGFGDDSPNESSSAVFKAQAIDSNNNGATDTIKITYISGPNLAASDVGVSIVNAGDQTDTETVTPAAWSPGEFELINPSPDAGNGNTWVVSVSVLDDTVVDTTVTLDE